MTTTPTASTTATDVYRPGDRVRFRFDTGHSSLDGIYEGTLSEPDSPDDLYLQVKSSDYSMHPVTTYGEVPRLRVVSPDGSALAYGIKDLSLLGRDTDTPADREAAQEPLTEPLEVIEATLETHPALESYGLEAARLYPGLVDARDGLVLGIVTTPGEHSGVTFNAEYHIEAGHLPESCRVLDGQPYFWLSRGDATPVTSAPEEAEPEADPLQAEVERLREQVRYHEGRADRAEQATIDIKREVGTVAMRYAREHGWCHTVRDALYDMGIEPIYQKHEVWLSLRVRVTGVASNSDPSYDWTRSSISVDGSDIARAITFDSDWEDVEVDSYSAEVDVDSIDLLED